MIYFSFMVIMAIITSILVLYRHGKLPKEEDKEYAISELISDDMLMLATVLLSIMTTSLAFIILIMGMNGLSPDDFNISVGVLVIISIMVLTVCLIWRDIGRKWIVIITVGTLSISLINYLIFQENQVIAASLPALLIALIGTSYKLIKSFKPKRPWLSMKLVSAHLIHLSVVLDRKSVV